jgi:urocanate hydratase
MMTERRKAWRKPVSLKSVIHSAKKQQFLGTVVDLSATGAKITFPDEIDVTRLAGSVRLVIIRDKIEVDGNIVWTRKHSAGLRFQSPFRRTELEQDGDDISREWTGRQSQRRKTR